MNQNIRSTSSRAFAVSGGGLISLNPPPSSSSSPRSSSTSTTQPPIASSSSSYSSIDLTPSSSFIRASSVDSDFIDLDTDLPPSNSNAPPSQKKRKQPPQIEDDDDGKKKKKKGKGKGKGKVKEKIKEPAFVATVPWPQHFLELQKVFKALNTVYTFISSRKGLATTFETLKGGVENLLKRPLDIHDISQLKSLLPELITFAYIDSSLLRVHAASAAGSSSSDIEKEMLKEQKRKEIDDAFERGARGSAPSSIVRGEKTGEKKETVLLFSFNDGEVIAKDRGDKLQVRKGSKLKAPANPTKPVYTTTSISTLITSRNQKFTVAVSELLVACTAHMPPQDPVQLLLEATEDYLPVDPFLETDEREGRRGKRGDMEWLLKNPDMRGSIEDILDEIKSEKWWKDQIVEGGHRVTEERDAKVEPFPPSLSQSIISALPPSITSLYTHQSLALLHLSSPTPPQGLIITTSTSSGKSLIYQLPMLQALESDPASTAFYVFPTKALAQDQMRGLSDVLARWEDGEDVKVATYDGDTKMEDREFIRENASVIFTNPDMLHVSILPYEEKWRRFFRNLKFVVVDELHYYKGLFGANVAWVMRRLRRICTALGNEKVQFISCSATIGNPVEHMKTIFGVSDVQVIEEDGSPMGRKEHIIWNPPYIDPDDPKQGRLSTISETSHIFRFLIDRGLRVIVFCKVRMQCEILLKQIRNDLMLEGRDDIAGKVMGYRSGYSAADRREIERKMFTGSLLGIIATTALELGIDIGSLDAVISVGFPYTLAGLRQQSGRAGRRKQDSLSMLICDPFPVDQFYARNPKEIFEPSGGVGSVGVDLENLLVLEGHLQCAAWEVPVEVGGDEDYFKEGVGGKGGGFKEVCERVLVKDEEGFYHSHPRHSPNPARSLPIRNTEDESYSIVDVTPGRRVEVLEEVEFSRAVFTIYEGAVFMHQGRTFLVKEVGHDRKLAKVEETSIAWRTRQRDFTNIDPLDTLAIREIPGTENTAAYGSVLITSIVFGYFKTDNRNNILDVVDISSPPFIRSSHGFWLDVPRSALEILLLKNLHPAASIHAAEHALMSLTPIVAMCADGDIRTECKQPEKELASTPSSRRRPARIILYDTSGKSGGVCAKAFDHISMLLTRAADTIASCECLDGCPCCVASSVCSGSNTIVSKLGALVVLESILGREIDIDKIPLQPPAFGVVPGGSIDLAGAGINMKNFGAGRRDVEALREMTDEEREKGEREREAALAELLGGGSSPVKEGRETFALVQQGGFVR